MSGTTFLVDCDTGVDDALALLYLLADPANHICGITTVSGNTPATVAAANTLGVLALMGRLDIPVAIGATATLLGAESVPFPEIHGENGVGGADLPTPIVQPIDEPAPQFLARMARQHPGELHVLATGPLTNLAAALVLEPRLPELVAQVTVMGGAAAVPGNVTPAAEANFHHDPEAARAVLLAKWPVTVVPLDATMEEVVTADHLDELASAGTCVASFAADALRLYLDFYERNVFGLRSAACHDPLAAAIAVGDVSPVTAPVLHVEVETGAGPARGAMITDLRGRFRDYPAHDAARTRVVLKTDGTFGRQLVDRLLAYDGSAVS